VLSALGVEIVSARSATAEGARLEMAARIFRYGHGADIRLV